jgi:hypothetical protein
MPGSRSTFRLLQLPEQVQKHRRFAADATAMSTLIQEVGWGIGGPEPLWAT